MTIQAGPTAYLPLTLMALVLNFSIRPVAEAGVWLVDNGLNVARYAHTSTLLLNGKVLVAGGVLPNSLFNGNTQTAELYDPATGTWTSITPMNSRRSWHTATLLPNGKVLVTGGLNSFNIPLALAELYDPVAGTWTYTGSLSVGRELHTATLLPNGKVLVTGGYTFTNSNYAPVAAAELYDPATGTWTLTGPMGAARYQHTATLLPNGHVMAVGGYGTNTGNAYLTSAELYDPATGTWTNTVPLFFATAEHTATLLPDGQVMVAGGLSSLGVLATTEFYDPATGSWAILVGHNMNTARRDHTATLLPNGEVLVVAGSNDITGEVSSAELYDPVAGTWTTTAPLGTGRHAHTATLMANGRVLVAGGYSGDSITSVETYDWAVGTWAYTGLLATPRSAHTATLLPDGKVLLAGGYGTNNGTAYATNGAPLANNELYDPATGTTAPTGPLNTARYAHTATLMPNGKVLAVGGDNTNGTLAGAELYDPAGGTWTITATMTYSRSYHTATLLNNGKVLVVGSAYVSELYDPITGTWNPTSPMSLNLAYHTATLLPSGQVLVAGGSDFTLNRTVSSAELYDPVAGTWTNTGSMNVGRLQHRATLLPSGKVLVEGGDYLGSAELYDPFSGTWTLTGATTTNHFDHTATLLQNGTVLITGGWSEPSGGGVVILNTAELYNPVTGAWSAAGPMNFGRERHTATLLPSGQVLVSAGDDTSLFIEAYQELYDVGLGFVDSWRPQLTPVASPFVLGTSLALSGSGFRGISEASGGNGSQDSASDYPLLQLHSLANEQTLLLLATNWSTNSTLSVPVNNFPPGWTLATVFANGIPSQSAIVRAVPSAIGIVLLNPAKLPGGSFQFSFTNVPGAVFTTLASTNLSLPLANWIPLGHPTEVSDGEFQFSDTQAGNYFLRFYRVTSP